MVAVATDTTGNMGKFGKLLRETYDVEHIYCVDHQIHRTAILAREDRYIPQGNGTMKCFRNLMQFFNSSTQALEKLLTSMKAANLPPLKPFQDNVTRWWSTYKSISRYLDNGVGDHITLLISHGDIGGSCVDLSPTHKMVLKDVRILLHPLAKAQNTLEGEKYPSISLVAYCVNYIRKCLLKATTRNDLIDQVRSLGERMLKDFKQRYGDGSINYYNPVKIGSNKRYVSLHPYHVFAAFLDPRLQHKDIVNNDEVERVWRDLKTYTINISAINNVQVVQPPPPANNNHPNMPVVRPPNLERAVDFYNSSEDDISVENVVVDNTNDIIAQEIALFRTGDRMAVRKFSMNRLNKEDQVDVIGWWKVKKALYPNLARSWERLVTITATSAPSERQWSILSNIITKNRNRIDHSVISDLMMAKENSDLLEAYEAYLVTNGN